MFPREAALWSPAFLQWQALRKSSAARRRGWLCLKGDLSPSSEAFLKSKRHRGRGRWVSRAPGLWVQLLNCIRVIKGAALKLGKERRLSTTELPSGPSSALEKQCQPTPANQAPATLRKCWCAGLAWGRVSRKELLPDTKSLAHWVWGF